MNEWVFSCVSAVETWDILHMHSISLHLFHFCYYSMAVVIHMSFLFLLSSKNPTLTEWRAAAPLIYPADTAVVTWTLCKTIKNGLLIWLTWCQMDRQAPLQAKLSLVCLPKFLQIKTTLWSVLMMETVQWLFLCLERELLHCEATGRQVPARGR